MKLDKELYTKHAKRLSSILNEKSTFVPYLAKGDFVKVIENSLNTLHAIEKTLTKVELAAKYSSKSLVKEFNKLGKNTFKIDEKFKYDDESDLIDNINYLHMYCKNIFKVDLDDLVEGKDVKVSNPKIDLRAKTDVEEMPNPQMGMGMGMVGMEGYQNPFVMGQAYAKVKREIDDGKIFTYTSKPKAVVIAKMIACVTLGLAILTLIVGAIFAFIAGGVWVQGKNYQGQTVEQAIGFGAYGAGIMYILLAGLGAYPLYQIIKGLVNKNDNLKYYFSWPWVLIFVLMVTLLTLSDIWWTWIPKFDTILVNRSSSSALMAYSAWKIMYLVIVSTAAICLIPMIIGAVCNPKQNKSLIEKLLQQYADELMGQYRGSVPPTDVQKPVEVKKPEKEDKKDKSGSKSKK